MKVTWYQTTQDQKWVKKKPEKSIETINQLIVTDEEKQEIHGFGGCFNELGWIALSHLSSNARETIMRALFHEKEGANFTFCRLPLGASDYAAKWYSLNESENDYDMKYFNINRDRKYLIPYIKEAMICQPKMKLFASPWSPPTWMKNPPVYNHGRIRMEEQVLAAYALYFKKFIEAYNCEGLKIEQIHIQNETFADQKFPSCLWSPKELKIFIGDYLGPLFEKEKIETEIWLGTLNGPEQMSFGMQGMSLNLYDKYVDEILFDQKTYHYISGIGYQWAGREAIQRTHDSFPNLGLMQTENECGDGQNSWLYAQYIFNLMRHYITNGANSYIYWNMVLEPGGKSTWGWAQNTLITVDPESKQVIYNPEYYVMKHLSRFVKQGARYIKARGNMTGASMVFKNPDGSYVVVASNSLDRQRDMSIILGGEKVSVFMKPNSFHTFVFEENIE